MNTNINNKIYKAEVIINEYDAMRPCLDASNTDAKLFDKIHVIEIWTLTGQMVAKTEIKKPEEKQ